MCEGVGAGGEGRKAVSLFEPHVRLSAPSSLPPPTLIVERGALWGLQSQGACRHHYATKRWDESPTFTFIITRESFCSRNYD